MNLFFPKGSLFHDFSISPGLWIRCGTGCRETHTESETEREREREGERGREGGREGGRETEGETTQGT